MAGANDAYVVVISTIREEPVPGGKRVETGLVVLVVEAENGMGAYGRAAATCERQRPMGVRLGAYRAFPLSSLVAQAVMGAWDFAAGCDFNFRGEKERELL